MLRAIAVTLASALVLVTACTQAHAKPTESNPLLAPWSGPYGGVPPFDRIRVEHFAPALEAGMAAQRRELNAITAKRSVPTFANTVLAFERSGRLLERVNTAYNLWSGSLSTPAFQKIERRMQPRLAAFYDEINQNPKLYQRIDAVYRSAEMNTLTPEQQRLVWSYRTAFVKNGATLNAAAKRRVAQINQRLATLYTDFGQNVLADEETLGLVISDKADLAGLSDADIEAASQEARHRGPRNEGPLPSSLTPSGGGPGASLGQGVAQTGRWIIANTRSAMEPFLARSPNRSLREKGWRLWVNRGDNGDAHDNNRIVSEILALRGERAKLQGFASFAHWKLSDSMAQQPQAAMDLMLKVWGPAAAQVRQQVAAAEKLAGFAIQPWDFRYYAEKLRQVDYDLDTNELTPYLQLDKLREAMFWAAGRLYGLRFEPVHDVPVFHPDVTTYKVLGAGGQLVGLWYFDPYAREGKNSGAWMDSYRAQQRLDGDILPIVSNNSNFKRGKPGDPVLVTWDDAVTMFHEFGHALHGLCSNVTYPSLAGPNSLQDFGEFPSQVNEYWLTTPPVLAMLVNTAGQPLPKALVDKMERARNFDKPFIQTEFLASALLDMKLHMLPAGTPVDPRAFEKAALGELGMPPAIVARHRIPQFGHAFSSEGYAAGYYGYLWAEVLSHDAFDAFIEAGNPFDAATAQRYLKTVLSVGNSVDPGEAFRAFRGRDPQVGALLRANGFAPAAATPASR